MTRSGFARLAGCKFKIASLFFCPKVLHVLRVHGPNVVVSHPSWIARTATKGGGVLPGYFRVPKNGMMLWGIPIDSLYPFIGVQQKDPLEGAGMYKEV